MTYEVGAKSCDTTAGSGDDGYGLLERCSFSFMLLISYE